MIGKDTTDKQRIVSWKDAQGHQKDTLKMEDVDVCGQQSGVRDPGGGMLGRELWIMNSAACRRVERSNPTDDDCMQW